MTISDYLQGLGENARAASAVLSRASTAQKNTALLATVDALQAMRETILVANQKDMDQGLVNNLDAALLDRLALTPERFDAMLEGLQQVATLADPIGEMSNFSYRPSGIQIGQMRVPLGVIGIIYESRPNVTVEAASLCLKSGNAAILRGGSEAFHSNQAIAMALSQGLAVAGLPETAVQVINTADREAVGALITAKQYVDVIVPRGGKGLIERIDAQATIPVIKHLDGICHVYVDSEADLEMALNIAENAKTHRYGTCNTMETLLVSSQIAAQFLPKFEALMATHQVELRACEQSLQYLSNAAVAATQADWSEEYLAPILAIKVVADIDAAITHINHYGSAHTDTIVTANYAKSRRFLTEVDSSSVMINASTRFADGFEYGLGAEIGISTDKLHARGPVGLEGLTSMKYVVFGDGHIRG